MNYEQLACNQKTENKSFTWPFLHLFISFSNSSVYFDASLRLARNKKKKKQCLGSGSDLTARNQDPDP